jgi:hypothetical protein
LQQQQTLAKEYQLKEKIEQFCEGDPEFKDQLTELYIRAFHELKNEYSTALEQKDTKKLSFTIHKHNTTLTLLELPHLLSEMEKGRKLITSKNTGKKSLYESVARVISMCDDILSELSPKVDLV